MDVECLRETLKTHGQEHLLQFWEELSPEHQASLYKELSEIKYGQVIEYFKRCTASLENANEKVDDHIEALPEEVCGSYAKSTEDVAEYNKIGLDHIGQGHVGVLLLAGGQGTRLGVNYPKGMYDVGLQSGKTLYQLQAERIVKLQELAKQPSGKQGIVPWYIMTSEHTKEPTMKFFEKHDFFGLKKENVHLFEQHTLPCMTFEGKIILGTKHSVAKAPDGNGGLYKALGSEGILEDLKKRGIKYLHVYCVDNILVKMADPVFIGFCVNKGAECGAKAVEKSFPTEAVGVVCKVDGKYQVVEYSEITLKTAEKRKEDGRLMYSAGNICNHFFTYEFLKRMVNEMEDQLQHHVAKKKIPFVDEKGAEVKPEKPNGIKMEKFVFDVFQFATTFAVWDVLREDEFSPLKNSEESGPKDNPRTARHALQNLHQRYVINAGGKFVRSDGTPIPEIQSQNNTASDNHKDEDEQFVEVEISPLVSYAGEGIEEKVKGKEIVPPYLLS